jgi:predicted RND superfamily exporter protein
VTSHYRGLASIGVVLCLGAVFCVLSTVFLLPSLFRYAELPGQGADRLAPGDAA